MNQYHYMKKRNHHSKARTKAHVSNLKEENESNCPNCGNWIAPSSHFCSHCGQDTHRQKLPFTHFVQEFLEGLLHFDTKIWSTLRGLLSSPGELILNYNSNKRARYVPPARLYIFFSVLFFLLASRGADNKANDYDSILENEAKNKGFYINLFHKTFVDGKTADALCSIPHIQTEQIDSIFAKAKIESTQINNRIIQKMIHLKRNEISAREISHNFISAISKIIFILMPLFAFLIVVIVDRKNIYYTEALAYSIYLHTLFYILLLISMSISYLFQWQFIYLFTYLIAFIYIFTSIKIAFQKSWTQALVLSLSLVTIYSIVFAAVFIAAFVGSIIL